MYKIEKFSKNMYMKKIVSIFLIVLLLTIILIININSQLSFAESKRYIYDGTNLSTSKYPGFKERIDVIKQKHPNWNFIIMETGLDFEQVIKAQYTGHLATPKNLIQGKSGEWVCSICGDRVYDTGNWKCASEQAIRYYMDTRNWLVDSPYLFQFLATDYLETTDDKVYNSLNGTFLYSRETASTINKVCKEKNANPYYVIARLLQEQGNAGGVTSKMVDTDGTVYYNLFNIGATGNTSQEVYNNALARAKKEGWTSIEKCLSDGITFLFSAYINNKQNSIYLNKFDVEPYGGLYIRQYMQNIEAPKSEGTSMYNKMKSAGLLDEKLTFIIPVYENMPKEVDGFKVIGKITIPKIDVEKYILEETTTESLLSGVTKICGPEINQIGNFCIAGHNYGDTFGWISSLEIGDEIYITDTYDRSLKYQVYEIERVSPYDISSLSQDTDSDKEITLVTCTLGALKRVIVKAIEVYD